MDFKKYTKQAKTFCIYKPDVKADCLKLGLMEEAGETAGVFKKMLRDNFGLLDAIYRDKVLKELGDLTWYIAMNIDYYKLNFIDFGVPKMMTSQIMANRTIELLSLLIKTSVIQSALFKSEMANNMYFLLALIEEVAIRLDYTMSDVYSANIAKLTKRKKEGKIHGEGSDR